MNKKKCISGFAACYSDIRRKIFEFCSTFNSLRRRFLSFPNIFYGARITSAMRHQLQGSFDSTNFLNHLLCFNIQDACMICTSHFLVVSFCKYFIYPANIDACYEFEL